MDRPSIPAPPVLRQAGQPRGTVASAGQRSSGTATHNDSPIAPASLSASLSPSSSDSLHTTPSAFASGGHDEFSKEGLKRAASASAASSASASVTPAAARSTVYRSTLTSRPLVRTLTAVLSSMVTCTLTVELKNGCSLRGRLDDVDRQGNMLFGPSVFTGRPRMFSGAPSTKVDSLFLPGHGVRYIHLPDRVDVKQQLMRWEQGQDDRLLMYKRKKRQGKFTTREEQERKIDAKERKLKEEMDAQRAAESQTGDSPSSSPILHTVDGSSSSDEPLSKKQKLDT